MATARKILGQAVAAGAGAPTLIYAVPAATDAVVSTVVVAETGGATATFKLCVQTSGTTVAAANALAFNIALAAAQTLTFTLGITLATLNTLTGAASTTTVTFTAFGQENS